jgi:serine/threonine-protein kinase
MATVHEAEDLRHHRKVAIKVLRPALAEAIGAERFLREIRTTANLNHPHILPLYDSGEAEGLLYFVMPFVSGESLRARIDREQQLPVEDAVQIAREIADALAFAHGQGVVHRDVKPGNILLEAGHAVLADFGIAHAAVGTDATRLTQVGMTVGSPAYMSPEQAAGEVRLDGRSDQYSLGCVLYEMLAGQPPFAGPTPDTVFRQHLTQMPPSVRVFRPAVPDGLEGVLVKLLGKSPADRYSLASGLVDALDRSIPGRSTGLKAAPKPAVLGFFRRNLLRGGGAVLALFLVLLVFQSVLNRTGESGSAREGTAEVPSTAVRPLDPRRVAVLYFSDISPSGTLGYLADGLTEAVIHNLSKADALDVVSANGSWAVKDHDLPREAAPQILRAGTLISGSVAGDGKEIRVHIGLDDGRTGRRILGGTMVVGSLGETLELKSELVREVSGLLSSRVGEEIEVPEDRRMTRSTTAWELFQRGEERRRAASRGLDDDRDGAFTRNIRAADSLFAEAEREDRNWAMPLVRRGLLSDLLARFAARENPEGALSWLKAGAQYVGRALQVDSLNAEAFLVRGKLAYAEWRLGLAPTPSEAEEAYQGAREDLERACRLDPSLAEAWSILSVLYSETVENLKAKGAAERAFQEDEFLPSADEVLLRLYAISYDLESFLEAMKWCDLGRYRFPESIPFKECGLWLMAAPSEEAPFPDPDAAWSLLEALLHGSGVRADAPLPLGAPILV